MRTTSTPGQFTIPTAPSAGTTVASSASANTYGSYVEMVASTSAALYVTGVVITLASGTNAPTYCSVAVATGPGASEVIQSTLDGPVVFTAAAAGSQVGYLMAADPWIPVAVSTRIAAKSADDVASSLSWKVKLICIEQADVLRVNMPGFVRGIAQDLQWLMVDTVGQPLPDLVDGDFTAKQVSLDGAAFADLANTIAEVANGIYTLAVDAGEWDGDLVTFRFEAPNAAPRVFTVHTT